LGAAIGFAGLLLVFSGFLFAQAASFPTETDDKIIDKYRNAGRWGLAPFLLALGVAGLSFAWLLDQSVCLYQLSLWTFGTLIVSSAIYGTVMLLWYL